MERNRSVISSCNGSHFSSALSHASHRSEIQARRVQAARSEQKLKTEDVLKDTLDNMKHVSKNCRVQQFLAGDMDEREELKFRLDIMEKREFIEELGVDEMAFAMRVEQLRHLVRIMNLRDIYIARENRDRVIRFRSRPHKSTTARHYCNSFGNNGSRNNGRQQRISRAKQYHYLKNDDESVQIYQFSEDLPRDQDPARNRRGVVDIDSESMSGSILERERRLETNMPSAQEIAVDSLRKRAQEGLIVFRLNGARDRKTISANVLHLTNTGKDRAKSNVLADVESKMFVRSTGDLLISGADRMHFFEQRRKQDERRRMKAEKVESDVAKARESRGDGGNVTLELDKIVKPQDLDFLDDEKITALRQKPTIRKANSRGPNLSSATDDDIDADATDAEEPDFDVMQVGKHRIRVKKVPVPRKSLLQDQSNRRASARAQKLVDRNFYLDDSSTDEDDAVPVIGDYDDSADEELHAHEHRDDNNQEDEDNYDDGDDTGVRDLDKFYLKRYGVNLTNRERLYNVYMRPLFEVQPQELFDGTPLLLRKATLSLYSDADVLRDLSCGLFPGGIKVVCGVDQDLTELKSFVYTEYIQYEPHTKKLIPRQMRCRCGICDCRSKCLSCKCKKDRCRCRADLKCPHQQGFRFTCKVSKRCILNVRTAKNNHYLAPINKHGQVNWTSILEEDGIQCAGEEEDVSAQLYEYLCMVCGPRCACPCAETIPIGYGPNPQFAGYFELRMTQNCGWGVFTTKFIPKGSYLFEYAGAVLSNTFIETRKKQSHYVFDVPIADEMAAGGGGAEILCVDALDMGNLSRFVNHSCVENCIARRVYIGHTHSAMSRLVYFARRDILPEEELLLNYEWDWWVHMYRNVGGMTCKCGNDTCKYTAEKMPDVLREYDIDRGVNRDDDDDDDDDDDNKKTARKTTDDLPKTEAEIAGEEAAEAENAAAADNEGIELFTEDGFDALLGISSDSSNVIRRDKSKNRKPDDDAIEIALLDASTRRAKKATQRNRRDMKMMTMTTIPENLTEIVLPTGGDQDVDDVAAMPAGDVLDIEVVAENAVAPAVVQAPTANDVGAVVAAADQADQADNAAGEPQDVSAGPSNVAGPTAAAAAAAPDQSKQEEEKKDEEVEEDTAAAGESRSLVERVFAQAGRRTRDQEFRQNIMNIINAPMPMRFHLDNLLENLCASTNRLSMLNGLTGEEFEDEKKEEKEEPYSVFADGSPSAMAMFIGNDEDADMPQQAEEVKIEPLPVVLDGPVDADAVDADGIGVNQHQVGVVDEVDQQDHIDGDIL